MDVIDHACIDRSIDQSISEPQAPAAFFVVRWLRILGPLGVEPPDATGLVALDAACAAVDQADHPGEPHEDLVFVEILLVEALEEASLPLASFLLLDPAQLPLRVLDLRLGGRRGLHVTALDGGRDVVPRPAALPDGLLLDGGHDERARLHVGDGVRLHLLLRAGVPEDEGVGPLPVDGVQRLLLPVALAVEDRAERVLLPAQPALARVLDLGDVAGRAGDLCGLLQLDEGRAVDQGLDVQTGQRDEVCLLLGRVVFVRARRRYRQDGMAELLHVDGAGEGGLLGVVSL